LRPISTVTKWGVRNDCCGLWSWGEKPLVDAATHEARKAAHEAFDPLWKDGHMSRAQAYAELRRVTGLNEKNCHMSRMDKGRAERVIPAVQQIFEGLHR
jgi:hypothetical protein